MGVVGKKGRRDVAGGDLPVVGGQGISPHPRGPGHGSPLTGREDSHPSPWATQTPQEKKEKKKDKDEDEVVAVVVVVCCCCCWSRPSVWPCRGATAAREGGGIDLRGRAGNEQVTLCVSWPALRRMQPHQLRLWRCWASRSAMQWTWLEWCGMHACARPAR